MITTNDYGNQLLNYIYFLVQDLKKRLDKLEDKNLIIFLKY